MANGIVEIFGFDQEVAAKLFVGFGKRAVADEAFALARILIVEVAVETGCSGDAPRNLPWACNS